MLEKLALFKIAFWRAPVFSTASWRRNSVMTSTATAGTASKGWGRDEVEFMR